MLNFFRKKPACPEQIIDTEREFLEIDATEHGIFTQLAPGTEFIGDMMVPEGVHMQGALVGNLRFGVSGRGATVLVENALIEGDVEGPLLHILGTIRGNIKASEVVVHSTAVVEGSITYRKLKMSPESTVNGSLRKMTDTNVAQMAPSSQPQYAEAGARK